MFSLINGGLSADTPKDIEVCNLHALDASTSFTVVNRRHGATDHTYFSFFRVAQNRASAISIDVNGQALRLHVPDAALDTAIRAMENLRDARDRGTRTIELAEPLIDDEPSDDAGPAQAAGHSLVERIRGTSAGDAITDALDAQRGDRTDDGPVAA
jgi:hypothetical protein